MLLWPKALLNRQEYVCYLERSLEWSSVILCFLAQTSRCSVCFRNWYYDLIYHLNPVKPLVMSLKSWITSSTLSLMTPSPSLSKALKAPAEVANRPDVIYLWWKFTIVYILIWSWIIAAAPHHTYWTCPRASQSSRCSCQSRCSDARLRIASL